MKRINIFIAGLCAVIVLQAQEAKQAFVNMPDSLIAALTKINREDCIDFLESNMKAQVKNRFDRQSEMTKLTADYIAMTLTPRSSVELKLLPVTDSVKVICFVRTVCSDACDSRVAFYTTDWQELPVEKYLQLPVMADFLPDSISTQAVDTLGGTWENLRAKADMLLMKAALAEEELILNFDYTTLNYMNKEDAEKLRPYLKANPICYEWKNGKFHRR